MKSYSRQYLFSCITGIILAASLFVTMSNSVFAHGKKHMQKDEMLEHMEAMMAVKEDIPEEYRVMNRTPILPDDESLQQGEKLFQQNCSVCHGEKGDGKGPAAGAMKTPPANFLEKKHSAMYGPGEKYWIIGNGTKKTGMPAFEQLDPLQRWHLVNHILWLQQDDSGDLSLESLF